MNEFASCLVRDGVGPKRNSLPSAASAEHFGLAQMLAERRKMDDEKLRKEEEQQERPPEKGAKRARMSIQKVNNK